MRVYDNKIRLDAIEVLPNRSMISSICDISDVPGSNGLCPEKEVTSCNDQYTSTETMIKLPSSSPSIHPTAHISIGVL